MELHRYTVRCIFRRRGHKQYEERITLWRAASFEGAIKRAELEAAAYGELCGLDYLGLAQAFLVRDRITNGSEVFSLIRRSSLTPRAYLRRFFDTGSELQGQLDDVSVSVAGQERRARSSRRK